ESRGIDERERTSVQPHQFLTRDPPSNAHAIFNSQLGDQPFDCLRLKSTHTSKYEFPVPFPAGKGPNQPFDILVRMKRGNTEKIRLDLTAVQPEKGGAHCMRNQGHTIRRYPVEMQEIHSGGFCGNDKFSRAADGSPQQSAPERQIEPVE